MNMSVRPATRGVCPPISGQTNISDLPLIHLIMAIGGAHFARRAVEFLNSRLATDHMSYFVLDHEFMPHFLDAASKAGSDVARRAGRLYERSLFYRQDPNAAHLAGHTGDDGVMLFRQHARDIRDAGYRDRLYRRFNLLERISLVRAVDGRWFTFNVYRETESGPFDAEETALLAALGPLLIACTAKHVELSAKAWASAATGNELPPGSRNYLEGLLAAIEPRLTPRERQVCALALMGRTVADIGRTLSIQQSTVATLRRRAYSKLGISKLNGLFCLCIARISGHNDAT
jgi:DNA-binding CsgD family transcriptional regulator